METQDENSNVYKLSITENPQLHYSNIEYIIQTHILTILSKLNSELQLACNISAFVVNYFPIPLCSCDPFLFQKEFLMRLYKISLSDYISDDDKAPIEKILQFCLSCPNDTALYTISKSTYIRQLYLNGYKLHQTEHLPVNTFDDYAVGYLLSYFGNTMLLDDKTQQRSVEFIDGFNHAKNIRENIESKKKYSFAKTSCQIPHLLEFERVFFTEDYSNHLGEFISREKYFLITANEFLSDVNSDTLLQWFRSTSPLVNHNLCQNSHFQNTSRAIDNRISLVKFFYENHCQQKNEIGCGYHSDHKNKIPHNNASFPQAGTLPMYNYNIVVDHPLGNGKDFLELKKRFAHYFGSFIFWLLTDPKITDIEIDRDHIPPQILLWCYRLRHVFQSIYLYGKAIHKHSKFNKKESEFNPWIVLDDYVYQVPWLSEEQMIRRIVLSHTIWFSVIKEYNTGGADENFLNVYLSWTDQFKTFNTFKQFPCVAKKWLYFTNEIKQNSISPNNPFVILKSYFSPPS